MDYEAFLSEWRNCAAEQGFLTESYGSVAGLDLVASVKGQVDLPCVYLSAGIHGDEPAGPMALLALLKKGFFDDRCRWLICPALNPSGLSSRRRESAAGMDLNRDYYLCETPEVCAHISWLKAQGTPALFLSLHEDWESSGFYYYEINLGGPGPSHHDLLAAAGEFFTPEPALVIDDHDVTEPGWIYHSDHPDLPDAWPEAIYLAKAGCPLSLTFETPSSGSILSRVKCHEGVVRHAVDWLCGRGL